MGPWLWCAGLLVSALEAWVAAAVSLEPVYWNTANKKFAGAGGYVLYPQIGDRLDLICPGVQGGRAGLPGEAYEWYKLYLVGGTAAARCELPPTPGPAPGPAPSGPAPALLLTCDRPERDVRFTIKFQEFSPNLWGHEFRARQDYYIITTSDGTKEGLENMKGGACLSRGMKVVLKVGQNPGSVSPKSRSEVPAVKDQGTLGGADPSKDSSPGSGNGTGRAGGVDGPLPQSNVAAVAGAAGGAAVVALLAAGVTGTVCWRRRRGKHSDTHHPPLSLGALGSPSKRGGGGGGGGGGGAGSGGNNNGSEPSDIIIPLRAADGAFCPHYEKVSGDYGHPVYIVQEMPPQSPANIYYKV